MAKQEPNRYPIPVNSSNIPKLNERQSKALSNFEGHQRLEELKVIVLEKAQRNMDATLVILRNWLK